MHDLYQELSRRPRVKINKHFEIKHIMGDNIQMMLAIDRGCPKHAPSKRLKNTIHPGDNQVSMTNNSGR